MYLKAESSNRNTEYGSQDVGQTQRYSVVDKNVCLGISLLCVLSLINFIICFIVETRIIHFNRLFDTFDNYSSFDTHHYLWHIELRYMYVSQTMTIASFGRLRPGTTQTGELELLAKILKFRDNSHMLYISPSRHCWRKDNVHYVWCAGWPASLIYAHGINTYCSWCGSSGYGQLDPWSFRP